MRTQRLQRRVVLTLSFYISLIAEEKRVRITSYAVRGMYGSCA